MPCAGVKTVHVHARALHAYVVAVLGMDAQDVMGSFAVCVRVYLALRYVYVCILHVCFVHVMLR